MRHGRSSFRPTERDSGPLTVTLFLFVRRHFYTERDGTAEFARKTITGLEWVKVNGETCCDPARMVRDGDTVAFLTVTEGRIDFEEKKVTAAALEECY